MKNLSGDYICRIIVGFCLLLSLGKAQAQSVKGINFFQGSWKQLLAEASKTGKPVFVDVYTDWCAPCKLMEKEVFVLPQVGEFYNSNFISYRLNAEKGEGPALAKTYGVSAYPTWLFIDADGTLRSRRTDYMQPEAFMAMAKTALGTDSASLQMRAFEGRFNKGEREVAFLKGYLKARKAMQLDNAEVLNAYMIAQKIDIKNPEEIRFLAQHLGRTWSAAIPLVVDRLNVFTPDERRQIASQVYDQTLYFAWGDAVNSGDHNRATQAMALAEKIYPLLSDTRRVNFDHIAIYHYKKLNDNEGLKTVGYRLAEKQMAVDTAMARKKDKELYEKVKHFFEKEPADANLKEEFNREKQMAAIQYSSQMAALLYETADAFDKTLPAADPARADAAKWAARSYLLVPNDNTKALALRLNKTR